MSECVIKCPKPRRLLNPIPKCGDKLPAMPNSNHARTIAAVQKMISEIQYLVDHPRVQQRTWVAKGQVWLPILHHVIEDLGGEPYTATEAEPTTTPVESNVSLLIKVSAGYNETFVNIQLDDIKNVTVCRSGSGYPAQRGCQSGFTLKNGQKYLTSDAEAQRVVDALRKRDESLFT